MSAGWAVQVAGDGRAAAAAAVVVAAAAAGAAAAVDEGDGGGGGDGAVSRTHRLCACSGYSVIKEADRFGDRM